MRLLSASLILLAATLVLACADSGDALPPQPPAATITTMLLPTSQAPQVTATAGVPLPPTNVRLSGSLPDLRTPVPPGEGERGRITVEWQDNAGNETSYRIYQTCGSGQQELLLEVPANTTREGPVQPCRPGRIGVAAANAAGVSAIVWSD